MEFSMITGW